MTLIEMLRREGEWHFARGTREKAADALEEALTALIAWHAAYDWSDQTQLGHAFANAKLIGDRVLTRYGIHVATTSVELKEHMLNAPGEDYYINLPMRRHRDAPIPHQDTVPRKPDEISK